MLKTVIFLLIFSLQVVSNHVKIIGGMVSEIKDIPYIVSVLFDGIPRCGGSVLSATHISTAAHCYMKGIKYSIRAGSESSIKLGQLVKVKVFYKHPKFKLETMAFDFGLLILHGKLKFGESVQIISLPEREVPDGSFLWASGWGRTYVPTDDPTQLRTVMVPKLSFIRCRELYIFSQFDVVKSMMCAGYLYPGIGVCEGDSGGPLVHNKTLYGITSWGRNCTLPFSPAVYANVFFAKDWFKDLLESKSTDNTKTKTVFFTLFLIFHTLSYYWR